MTLYNLKHDGDQYRITKFTNDLEVESSYLIGIVDGTEDILECDCPAGHHFSCRHRQMFHNLLPIVDTEWFWNFEGGFTCNMYGALKSTCMQVEAEPEPEPLPPLLDDIQALTFDEPAAIHNAIAKAVGEPWINIQGPPLNQFVVVENDKRGEGIAPAPPPIPASWRRI